MGLTPPDLIAPLFLFAIGLAWRLPNFPMPAFVALDSENASMLAADSIKKGLQRLEGASIAGDGRGVDG